MLNARSPASSDEDGSDAPTLYLSAKLFTPATFEATVLTLAIDLATVFTLLIAPPTDVMFALFVAAAVTSDAMPATVVTFPEKYLQPL